MLSFSMTSNREYLKLIRVDHWVKNVLIIPGYILALVLLGIGISLPNLTKLLLTIISLCVASSANYVINEFLDRNSDEFHPIKRYRISNKESLESYKVIFLYLILIGIALILTLFISVATCFVLIIFICFGILYNVPPIRFKDRFLIDIYLESLNSPIRFVIGWLSASDDSLPPISTILLFLFGGAFLMSAKRVSELNLLRGKLSHDLIVSYRKSFRYYTPERLIFIMQTNFGFAIALLTIFTTKYNPDFIYYIIVVVFIFALYSKSTFGNEIHVTEKPHFLYKDRSVIIIVLIGILSFALVSYLNLNFLQHLFDSKQLEFSILKMIDP